MTANDVAPLDGLKADLSLCRKRALARLQKLPEEDATTQELLQMVKDLYRELAENVYPGVGLVCDEIAEVDEVMQEVIEQQESYIHPHLADVIKQALGAGVFLAQELRKQFEHFDDVTKKRFADLTNAVERSAEIAFLAVEESTTEPGDEDDETEEEDDDKTPVEIPQTEEPEPSPAS